tara:strand:- start:330 stop:533 length:204 start_codon:yes stop_codon:yes gene_type:complete
MDKLEAVQKILRFSPRILDFCEREHHVFFDEFDSQNVDDYEGGYGQLSDSIITEGIIEKIIEEDDID